MGDDRSKDRLGLRKFFLFDIAVYGDEIDFCGKIGDFIKDAGRKWLIAVFREHQFVIGDDVYFLCEKREAITIGDGIKLKGDDVIKSHHATNGGNDNRSD